MVCVCGADEKKPRYNRVFTGTIGKKICATTKNRPIYKIEYIATVDLIDSYLIDRTNRILLEFAIYLVNRLHINYLYSIFNSYSQTVAIAI